MGPRTSLPTFPAVRSFPLPVRPLEILPQQQRPRCAAAVAGRVLVYSPTQDRNHAKPNRAVLRTAAKQTHSALSHFWNGFFTIAAAQAGTSGTGRPSEA